MSKIKLNKTKNVLTVCFFVVFLFRLFTKDRFTSLIGVFSADFLSRYTIYNNKLTYLFIFLLRFLSCGAVVSLLVQPFFKYDSLKILNTYVLSVVFVLEMCFVKPLTLSYVDKQDYSYVFRIIQISVEALLGLSVCVINYFTLGKDVAINVGSTLKSFGLLLAFGLFADNNATPQFLFGKIDVIINAFNFGHFLVLALALLLAVIMIFALKNKDKEFQKFILLACR